MENVEDVKEMKEKSSEVEKEKEEEFACNFKTQSKQGIKSHKTKKHKEITSHCGAARGKSRGME